MIKNLKEIVKLQKYFKGPARIVRRMIGGYSPFPLLIVLYVTLRCNMKCQMCGQREEYLAGGSGEKDPMSLEEWEALLDNIQRSFFIKPFIHLIGGEPLVFPHTKHLLESLKRRKFRVSMTTNGLILKQNVPLVLDANLWHLNVSLDGPQEIHDRIRGIPDGFDRVMEGITTLQEEKKRRGIDKPRVCINCVITPENVGELLKVVEIARGVGVDSLSFQHLMFTEEMEEKMDVSLLMETIQDIRARSDGFATTFFPRVGVEQITPYYHDLTYDFDNFCLTPWYRFDIFPNGDLRVCRQIFGNVRSGESVKTIWNGSPFREFRKSLVREGLHLPHCVRCCHRLYD